MSARLKNGHLMGPGTRTCGISVGACLTRIATQPLVISVVLVGFVLVAGCWLVRATGCFDNHLRTGPAGVCCALQHVGRLTPSRCRAARTTSASSLGWPVTAGSGAGGC
jgi:hypothetical protein